MTYADQQTIGDPERLHPIDAVLPTFGDVRLIFEIGCHRMLDTKFLRAVFPAAAIIAFDPDPRNAAFIRASDLPSQLNVTFEELAVGGTDASCDFYLSSNFMGDFVREWTQSSSLRRPRGQTPDHVALARGGAIPHAFVEQPVTVKCVSLDSYCYDRRMRDPIDFIWCDAQGAEDMIINGAPNTLKRTMWLLLEHNTSGCYCDAPDVHALTALLPAWQPVHVWPYDILLRNTETVAP